MGNYLLNKHMAASTTPPPTLVIPSLAPWTDTSAWSRRSSPSPSLSSPWLWPPSRLLSQITSPNPSSTPTDSSDPQAHGWASSSLVFTSSPSTLDSVILSARSLDTDTLPSTSSTTLLPSVRATEEREVGVTRHTTLMSWSSR